MLLGKLDYFLILCTKINSKWIKDLNARLENMKLIEESRACTFFYIGLGNIFLEISPQARKTKTKIDKWDYITLKGFCIAKETINKTKRPLIEWEMIFADDTFKKGLIPKIYKELIQFYVRKTQTK